MKNGFVSDVLEMCREIRKLQNENMSIAHYNYNLGRKIERLNDKIREYEKKLEIVSDIICKHIDHSEDGYLYISSMWDVESDNDFKTMIDTLEISLTESEIKNE